MRRPEPRALAARIAQAGGKSPRFVADAAGARPLSSLPAGSGVALSFHGRSLLLAMPDQAAMMGALVALDGIARRLIIWPDNEPPADVTSISLAGAVDAMLTGWPPADEAAAQAGPPLETEWVLFTSGTTGRPKMVVHTLQTLAGHLLNAPPPSRAPVWCSFYDIRRYGGMQVMLRALLGGGSLVLSEAGELPCATLRRAAALKATHVLGTPSHWRRALISGEADLLRPEYIRLSGEIAGQAILDRLREAFPTARIVHAFASTEAGLAFEVDDGRAGMPAAFLGGGGGFAEIALRDGVLHVRSPRNARGYLDGRIVPLRGGEWVDTGDRMEVLDDRLVFAGRSDGVINVGGQKIHPEEVEDVLQRDPAVQMCAVRARASPITGAVVTADVVAQPGAPTDLPARLRALCRQHLAPHKVPATIRLVPALDIAASGKLARGVA